MKRQGGPSGRDMAQGLEESEQQPGRRPVPSQDRPTRPGGSSQQGGKCVRVTCGDASKYTDSGPAVPETLIWAGDEDVYLWGRKGN